MQTLLDIWKENKGFFAEKSLEQVINIAGNGKLTDGSEASIQFRELLTSLPSTQIEQYALYCLENSFQNSGIALQDIANEVGNRLGMSIKHGRYRGNRQDIGYDGLWRSIDNHAYVIEVKTTDAYQINLDVQAGYRERLIESKEIKEDASSILIIVGRNDTGGLEAQTRGSRHAWDIRIISIEALIKLMKIKEELSDQSTVQQIQGILKPVEYTKVDKLIDTVFLATSDIKEVDEPDDTEEQNDEVKHEKSSPVSYHEKCIPIIAKHLSVDLIKDGRCTYISPDKTIRLLCIVSKEYNRSGYIRYWYAFHPRQKEFLESAESSYISLGCGSENQTILIPFKKFFESLDKMRITEKDGKFYWHVEIFKKGDRFLLNKSTEEGIDVSEYLLNLA